MASIETRLDQIEKQLGEVGCICSDPAYSQIAIVVIKDDWGSEDLERAEASTRFSCPTHGVRSRPLLRISQVDANL
jgi:hypothetical protein